jgi:hypothetical protein
VSKWTVTMRFLSHCLSALCVAHASNAIGDPLAQSSTTRNSQFIASHFEQRAYGQKSFRLSAENAHAPSALVKDDLTATNSSAAEKITEPTVSSSLYEELSTASKDHIVQGHKGRISISAIGSSPEALEQFQPVARMAVEHEYEGYRIATKHRNSSYAGSPYDLLILLQTQD